MTQTEWDELSVAEQMRWFNLAEQLIDRGYITQELTTEHIAKNLFEQSQKEDERL